MEERISVTIADDHPIMRQGLRLIIERESDLRIIAECGDGETALKQILEYQPDVAILDIDMPHRTGLGVLEALGKETFAGKVILMTVHGEEEFFNEALTLGANGYVLKDSATEEILSAIRAVVNGQNFVSTALTAYLFDQKRSSPVDRSGIESLTPTERRVLRMIAEYQTTKQIAEALFISPLTVKTHRRNISIKLNLEGNHALMKFAVEHHNRS